MAQNPTELEIDPIEIVISPVDEEEALSDNNFILGPVVDLDTDQRGVGSPLEADKKPLPTFEPPPELLKLYRTGTDIETGETVNLNAEEQTSYLLQDVAEILSENPYYLERGGINVTDLKTGKGPLFEELFPEFFDKYGGGTEALSEYYNAEDYEKERLILSRLTNLDEAVLSDYLKEGVKGGVEGYAAAKTALKVGRAAFTATLPFSPQAAPFVGIAAGLGSAIVTGFGINTISEKFLPRKENLLPGESSELEGVKSAANILAGAPVVKEYALKAYGPSMLVQRMKEAGPVKLTRGQRFSAYIDEMFPKARALYEKNPKKFLASEAALAAGVGTVVSEFELDQDPLLRTAVELGLGLTPTYTFVDLAQRATTGARSAVRGTMNILRDYGPTGLALRPGQTVQNYKDLYKRLAARLNTTEEDISFLQTEDGQRAAYKVLQFFIQNGENPKEVLQKLKSGVNWLDGLPQEALDVINQEGAGGIGFGEAIENITPGMRAGSPTLIMLENFFRKQSEEIKNAKDPIGKKAAEFQRALIKLFSIGGGKDQLEIARELQQQQLTQLMILKLNNAVDEATKAALQTSRGKNEYDRLTDISVAQTRALENQFNMARGIATALYEEARKVGGIGKLTQFFDSDGKALETPSFIKEWDRILAESSDGQISRWQKDSFFQSVQSEINKFKTQLNLSGAPAATPQQLKLENTLKKEDYSQAKTVFERILNNDFDYSKAGEEFTNAPVIAVTDEGIPLATERNIENLTILMDRFMNAVKTPKVKTLLQLQKEALQSEIALEKGLDRPREGVDFSDLVNLGKDLTSWKAQTEVKSNDLHGIASVLKRTLFNDLNNTIPADTSQAFNTARSFYLGFKDAITRSIAGIPSRRKAYDERLVDPEDYLNNVLKGDDINLVSKFRNLFNAGKYLRDQGDKYFDANTVIEVIDPLTGRTSNVLIQESIKDSINTVESLTREALSRDIISPLQKALNRAESLGLSMPEQQALEIKARVLADELAKIKTRLSGDEGEAFKEIFGEGFVNDVLRMEDGLKVLQKARSAYNLQKEDIANDLSFGIAVNSSSPYSVVKKAVNNTGGTDILDAFIRDIKKTSLSEDRPEGWSEEKALAGLKKNLLDVVYEKSGGVDGFSADKAFSVLFKNGGAFKDQPDKNLADYMLRRRLITETELNNYAKLLKSIREFELGAELGNLQMTGEGASMAKILAAKLIAVRLVKAIPGSRQQGLIEETAASRFATDFIDRLPGLKEERLMREIIQDEKLLQLVLKEPVDNPEQRSLLVTIMKRLGIEPEVTREALRAARERISSKPGRAGSVPPRVISPDDFEEKDQEGESEPQASIQRTPAAPTVAGAAAPRPAPFVVAQAPVASPPPAQQARPADRSRFAAAFPSDITAPFIKQQGIETLLT